MKISFHSLLIAMQMTRCFWDYPQLYTKRHCAVAMAHFAQNVLQGFVDDLLMSQIYSNRGLSLRAYDISVVGSLRAGFVLT
jgi:hypothetical protein